MIPQLPETIKILESFDKETIVDGKGKVLASGDVILVEGSTMEIERWLKPVEEFWTTDNPMFGTWKTLRVKNI